MRALLVASLLVTGCASSEGRLRVVSSYATQASWSLVVDDRARGGQILIDGRPRIDDCNRVRTEIRCELRGLWPGGHTIELRVAGSVLRRSVLLGKPWRDKPTFRRAGDEDAVDAAAKAKVDGVVIVGGDWRELVDYAHKKGLRALVVGDAGPIDWAGADGVIGGTIPRELQARFPEARAFDWDRVTSS